jgi:hypothetical protein
VASAVATIAGGHRMIELDFWGYLSSQAIVEAIDAAGIQLGVSTAPATDDQPTPGGEDSAS